MTAGWFLPNLPRDHVITSTNSSSVSAKRLFILAGGHKILSQLEWGWVRVVGGAYTNIDDSDKSHFLSPLFAHRDKKLRKWGQDKALLSPVWTALSCRPSSCPRFPCLRDKGGEWMNIATWQDPCLPSEPGLNETPPKSLPQRFKCGVIVEDIEL